MKKAIMIGTLAASMISCGVDVGPWIYTNGIFSGHSASVVEKKGHIEITIDFGRSYYGSNSIVGHLDRETERFRDILVNNFRLEDWRDAARANHVIFHMGPMTDYANPDSLNAAYRAVMNGPHYTSTHY